MKRVKVTIESNELDEPMVFEDLLTFACVGIESVDYDGYKTIKFGVGDLTPAKTLTTVLTLIEMMEELFIYIKENTDPQTFSSFISCFDEKMSQKINSRSKRKTD